MSHTEGPHEDDTGAGGALAASNVTLLPDHMLGEIIDRTHAHDLLALFSSCKTFKRVLALNTAREVAPPPDAHVVTSLAKLEWALGNGWAWPAKNKHGRDDRFAACNLTASGGCVAVVQRAHEDGCHWDAGACFAAAKGGHLEVLMALRANGCPWDSKTCSGAALKGHLDCLEWAHDNGCPWDNEGSTCSNAAEGGHLECLKWLRANGCPWNEETCSNAALRGHLECLKWARTNECPWEKHTCEMAAAGGHLECLKWARANGCPWDGKTLCEALVTGTGRQERYDQILEWARANGCPEPEESDFYDDY